MAHPAAPAFGVEPSLAQAVRHFNEGDYAESEELLTRLSRANPENALVWFNLGNARFKRGRFEQAAEAYRRVVELGSSLAPAALLYEAKSRRSAGALRDAAGVLAQLHGERLPDALARQTTEEKRLVSEELLATARRSYEKRRWQEAFAEVSAADETNRTYEASVLLGMTLLKMGRPDEAAVSFKRARTLARGAGERGALNSLQRSANTSTAGDSGPLSAALAAGAGYNSNVFGTSDGASASAASVLGSVTFYGTGEFRSDLVSAGRSALSGGYRVSWLELSAVPEARTLDHTFDLEMRHEAAGWAAGAGPSLAYRTLGMRSFLLQPELSAWAGFRLGSVQASIAYRFNHTTALDQIYAHLEGPAHSVSLSLGGRLASRLRYRLTARAISEALDPGNVVSSELPVSNRSVGPELRLEWTSSSGVSVKPEVYFLHRMFEPTTPLLRVDDQLGASIRIEAPLGSSGLSWTGAAVMIRNSSLVDEKNYSQWTASSGLRWEIGR